MTRARSGLVAASVAVALVVPMLIGDFWLGLATVVCLYALAATGLDLTFGRAGLLSVGHAAFFGIGAYTVALGDRHTPLSGLMLLLLAIVTSGVAGLLVGAVAIRVAGFYFALLTLATATIFGSIVNGLSVTGGPSGITDVSRDLFGTGQLTRESLYVIAFANLALVIAALRALRRSRAGRAMEAVRTQERTAAAAGVNVFAVRLQAFTVGTVIAGVAGGLFAQSIRYVSPDFVGLAQSVEFLIVTVVGGLGTIWGVIPGALVVRGLPELVQGLRLWQQLILGVLTLLVLLRFRLGVAGTIELALRRRAGGRPGALDVADDEVAVEAPPLEADMVARRAAPGDGPVLLSVEEVSRRFGGLLALDAVSLDVRPGEIHALVGPNGAGKTTLVNLISGIDRPTSGRVLLKGEDVTALPAHRRARRGIARTFQLVGLADTLTVRENVMLGAYPWTRAGMARGMVAPGRQSEERQVRDAAAEVLERLGLAAIAERLPAEIPQGQRRLTEVARCLLSRADLLLLDEPAAGLNETETKALGRRLREISAGGTAILLIEHDMPLVMAISDRVTVINFGRRIASGLPSEVAADPQVVEAYLGSGSGSVGHDETDTTRSHSTVGPR